MIPVQHPSSEPVRSVESAAKRNLLRRLYSTLSCLLLGRPNRRRCRCRYRSRCFPSRESKRERADCCLNSAVSSSQSYYSSSYYSEGSYESYCEEQALTSKQEETQRVEMSSGTVNALPTRLLGPSQTRVLLLNDGEHQEHVLYRLQKGTLNGYFVEYLIPVILVRERLEAPVPLRPFAVRQEDQVVRESPGCRERWIDQ